MVLIKTPQQVAGIKASCKLLAQIMEKVKAAVVVGATPKQLNDIAEAAIEKAGAKPAFKGYKGSVGLPFPTALCASLNDIVVHGPATSTEPLRDGDVIGLDLGLNLDGYYSDMAVTLPVGQIDDSVKKMLEVTKKSLENGIAQVKPGNKIRDISKAIEQTILPHGFGIVKMFVGHGVGLKVHEDPMIPNYVGKSKDPDLDIVLKVGMVLAIEPMVTLRDEEVNILSDGWSVATADGSLTAHFEHSVAVTENGHEILTAYEIFGH